MPAQVCRRRVRRRRMTFGSGDYRGLEELSYPFHDHTIAVTRCGRICFKGRKINFSHVFAGQNVGVTQVSERVWLVSFMHYDLGYFDDETCRLERSRIRLSESVTYVPRNKPSPMCPERTIEIWLAALDDFRNWLIREAV